MTATPVMRTVATLIVGLTCALYAAEAGAEPGYKACAVGRDKDFLNHTWMGQTMKYRVIRSSLPPQANTTRKENRYIWRIRNAAARWGAGANWCDKDYFSGFNSQYIGDSGYSAADHGDDESTIDFANGKCFGMDATGCAHTDYTHPIRNTKAGRKYSAIATDIRIRRNVDWYAGKREYEAPPGKPCPGQDLLGLAMHEMGHAVGASDLYDGKPGREDPAKNTGQVMGSPPSRYCNYWRRYLGRADYIMLRELYSEP